MMLKTMENLMDRLTIYNKPLNREQNEPQIRNLNFRRRNPPPPPQIRQRDMRNLRNPNDQQIMTPFTENYVADEDEAESIKDHIHHFGDLDSEIYLTEEEHSTFSQEDDNNYFEEESEQYQRGYLHAIDDIQRKIKLRYKDVTVKKKGSIKINLLVANIIQKRKMKNIKILLYIKNLQIKQKK